MTSPEDASSLIARLVRGMLADPVYLLPLAAAQDQFRDRYYGLSAAAMLEDLFYDTMANYVAVSAGDLKLSRPPKGEKGWDYSVNGNRISHKVGKSGPEYIAALWDATRTDITTWTFDYPIAFVCGAFRPSRFSLTTTGGAVIRSRECGRNESSLAGEMVVLVRWLPDSTIDVLHIWDPVETGSIRKWLTFRRVWQQVKLALDTGTPANFLEILVVRSSSLSVGDSLQAPTELFRPGVYVLDPAQMIDLPVTPNNRALLVSKDTVANLMKAAASNDRLVPFPLWFSLFAGEQPPDLYLAQKAAYDAIFQRFAFEDDV